MHWGCEIQFVQKCTVSIVHQPYEHLIYRPVPIFQHPSLSTSSMPPRVSYRKMPLRQFHLWTLNWLRAVIKFLSVTTWLRKISYHLSRLNSGTGLRRQFTDSGESASFEWRPGRRLSSSSPFRRLLKISNYAVLEPCRLLCAYYTYLPHFYK